MVTAWRDPTGLGFFRTMQSSRWVEGAPKSDEVEDLNAWTEAIGIPTHAIVHLDYMSHSQLAEVLGFTHLAVFPNRCESGTNLVAMETMARGIPTVLSNNTGHLDLTRPTDGIGDPEHCYVLRKTSHDFGQPAMLSAWGESDVTEVIERIDDAREDQARAFTIGQAGAAFIRDQYSWGMMVQRLTGHFPPGSRSPSMEASRHARHKEL